jgi:hypothetical protein
MSFFIKKRISFKFLWLSGRDHANFQVLAGQTDIRKVEFLSRVIRVTEHPEYNGTYKTDMFQWIFTKVALTFLSDFELWNDIVILRLENNLVFGSNIRPTTLPSPTHDVRFY